MMQRDSPLYIGSLVSYLAYLVIPAVGNLASLNVDYDLAQPWFVAIQIATVVLALISGILVTVAAFSSRATTGRRVGGGLLGILAIIVSIIVGATILGVFWFLGAMVFAKVVIPAALFLSWAIARPFRGPGYFALLVWIALSGITIVIQFVIPWLGFNIVLVTMVNLLLEVVVIVVTLVVALALEKRRRAARSRAAQLPRAS